MLNIAICDDEKILCDLLKTQIQTQLENLQMESRISAFLKPSDLYQALEKETSAFDMIFLDLDFHVLEEDGIIWAQKIRQLNPSILIIILTCHEERYKEGYVARAFRFMTKPVDSHELEENLSACLEQLQIEHHICITSNGKIKKIPLNQILYLSAQSGGCDIYTEKEVSFKEESLIYWEDILSPHSFFRVHKKYIINLYHVKEITNHSVILSNNEKLPVSRRKWTALRLAFMKFDIQKHV